MLTTLLLQHLERHRQPIGLGLMAASLVAAPAMLSIGRWPCVVIAVANIAAAAGVLRSLQRTA